MIIEFLIFVGSLRFHLIKLMAGTVLLDEFYSELAKASGGGFYWEIVSSVSPPFYSIITFFFNSEDFLLPRLQLGYVKCWIYCLSEIDLLLYRLITEDVQCYDYGFVERRNEKWIFLLSNVLSN